MASHSEKRLTTPRPFAVWIALGILFLYIPIFLLPVLFPWNSYSVLDEREFSDVVIDTIELALVIISLVVAFWTIAVRKQWGRWFVAAFIAYFTGREIWDHLILPELLIEEPYDKTDILLGTTVGLAPLLVVILLVSFGANVKKYFSTSDESGDAE